MKTRLAALILLVMPALTCTSEAAPFSPVPAPPPPGAIFVKDGCGVGFQRLPDGTCRPQKDGPALMRLFARKCPVGYRRNLMGKCRKE